MSQQNLYVVRRCDAFYRCWHDVTEPASIHCAQAAYDRLTNYGRVFASAHDPEHYGIFATSRAQPLVRSLHAHDLPLIEEHLLRLDAADRRLRFFQPIDDAQIRRYVRAIDWRRSQPIGAMLDERLIGVVEVLFDRAAAPCHAEIAVTVDSLARGQGLGRQLVDLGVDMASARGVTQIGLSFLRENRSIQRIIRTLGGTIDMEDLIATIPVRRYADAPELLAA